MGESRYCEVDFLCTYIKSNYQRVIINSNTLNLKVIIGAASANFGILFSGFLTGLGTSSTVTAWIQNLGLVLSALCCYLVDPLVEEFGWRMVSLVMGVMMAVGMSLSAFATSALDLFFTYSVLASRCSSSFVWQASFIHQKKVDHGITGEKLSFH